MFLFINFVIVLSTHNSNHSTLIAVFKVENICSKTRSLYTGIIGQRFFLSLLQTIKINTTMIFVPPPRSEDQALIRGKRYFVSDLVGILLPRALTTQAITISPRRSVVSCGHHTSFRLRTVGWLVRLRLNRRSRWLLTSRFRVVRPLVE